MQYALFMKSLFLLFDLFALTANKNESVHSISYAAIADIVRHTLLPLVGLYLICRIILIAIKMVLSYLLKQQIIACATPEDVVKYLLPINEEKNQIIKNIIILISLGFSLFLCELLLPVGIYWLVTIAFSLALGFCLYYIYLKISHKF